MNEAELNRRAIERCFSQEDWCWLLKQRTFQGALTDVDTLDRTARALALGIDLLVDNAKRRRPLEHRA